MKQKRSKKGAVVLESTLLGAANIILLTVTALLRTIYQRRYNLSDFKDIKEIISSSKKK